VDDDRKLVDLIRLYLEYEGHRESGRRVGGYAATSWWSLGRVKVGYQRWKSSASTSLRTRVRICRSR
jgi:hypothetical protein